jgi:hypothetical protein
MRAKSFTSQFEETRTRFVNDVDSEGQVTDTREETFVVTVFDTHRYFVFAFTPSEIEHLKQEAVICGSYDPNSLRHPVIVPC